MVVVEGGGKRDIGSEGVYHTPSEREREREREGGRRRERWERRERREREERERKRERERERERERRGVVAAVGEEAKGLWGQRGYIILLISYY